MKRLTEPMSVKMETKLVVKIAGCTHRLTIEKARDLHAMLSKFLCGESQSAGVQRVRDIRSCVIEHFGLHPETFASRARHEVYAWPRLVAMALSREMVPKLTLTEIGNEFGREHSLVQYAMREVTDRIMTYPDKRAEVEAIRAKLNGTGGAQ